MRLSENYLTEYEQAEQRKKRARNIKAWTGIVLCFVSVLCAFVLIEVIAPSSEPGEKTVVLLTISAPFFAGGLYFTSRIK